MAGAGRANQRAREAAPTSMMWMLNELLKGTRAKSPARDPTALRLAYLLRILAQVKSWLRGFHSR